LGSKPPATIDELRLLEAWAAISYFAAWRAIELRWKGTGKKPIPPEWRRIGVRQEVLRRRNRNAHHPVNALLNYGYAVLESQVRIAIAKAGLDPSIGYLHVCQAGRDSLVYDLMEPYRPQVDRDILAFVQSQTFTPRDFVIDSKGVCRLHPELARNLALAMATVVRPCLAAIWVAKLLEPEPHAGSGRHANPAVESSLSRGEAR
jgi:CRISPR-associated endonuclease Cas1